MNDKNYASFGNQFVNSFVPTNYGEYFYVDKSDTTKFLRIFAVIVYVIIAAAYLFAVSGGSGGKALSEQDGYYYRVSKGELVIDEPILVDDLANGVYVNITDEVGYFDGGDDLTALIDKGYKDILLISRTNRVKVLDGGDTGFGYVVNYTDFDDMETEGWGAENTPTVSINTKFIAVLVVIGVVFCFVYPFIVWLSAVILSFIAGLFCSLFRLGTDREFLKTAATYAFVPAQVVTLIAFAAFTLIYGADFISGGGNSVYSIIEIIAAVLPLILVMAAAVADRKNS